MSLTWLKILFLINSYIRSTSWLLIFKIYFIISIKFLDDFTFLLKSSIQEINVPLKKDLIFVKETKK